MDQAQAEKMLAELTAYFREPVMPVSRYCGALTDWRRVQAENLGFAAVREIDQTFMAIRKSSLLARLIYGGEKLRTVKCPTHQGKWSGLDYPSHECACHMTGWLPAESVKP